MALSMPIEKAGRVIRAGGVVAYPTEGVFGLGCLPDDEQAVTRILRIKKRDPAKGLIIVASCPRQLQDWVDLSEESPALRSRDSGAITWVVKAAAAVPFWIQGEHSGIAVRVTSHPVAASLCDAADSALVSTSANISGQPATRNAHVLRRTMGHLVDYIVPGACGPDDSPSEIRDLRSGTTLRLAD
jgi:L-threonylcarbamoyladenylate synthase